MSYWRLFYHIVWATKERLPLIEPDFEKQLHDTIAAKSTELGAKVYAVGGIENHVHIAVSIPPRIALSEFVRQIKGSTSYYVSHDLAKQFGWQQEFGIISFNGKQLDWVVNYVKNQRQHHTIGKLQDFMEQSQADKPK